MIQLVVATAADCVPTPGDLARMLVRLRSRYGRAGVTGLTVYHQGSYLHILEGPDGAVGEAFADLDRDPDHLRPLVVRRVEVRERTFGGWGAAYVAEPRVPQPAGHLDYLGLRELAACLDDHGPWRAVAEFCRGRLRQATATQSWASGSGRMRRPQLV